MSIVLLLNVDLHIYYNFDYFYGDNIYIIYYFFLIMNKLMVTWCKYMIIIYFYYLTLSILLLILPSILKSYNASDFLVKKHDKILEL